MFNGTCICEICKKEFIRCGLKYHITHKHEISDEEYYTKYMMNQNENICKMFGKVESCKKYSKFISLSKGFHTYCSQKCMANDPDIKKKKKETSLKVYGTDCPMKNENQRKKFKQILKSKNENNHDRQALINEKRKQTTLKTYNCENISQLDEIKDKKRQTCLKNYGVLNPSESKEILKKQIRTIFQKYGVYNAAFIPGVLEKKKKTCLKKYGVDWHTKNDEVKQKFISSRIKNFIPQLLEKLNHLGIELLDEYKHSLETNKWKCKKCNTVFYEKWDYISQDYRRCPTCYPKERNKSRDENEISEFLAEIVGKENILRGVRNIIKNEKTGHFFELDIYVPLYKIAIEYNSFWWHNEKIVSSKYHLIKTIKCLNEGITLIHIFEDEWKFKKDIVKERIKYILGVRSNHKIYARNCIIKEIKKEDKREFLKKFHLQGNDSSQIRLGAFYNNELVSVMTFSKGNISKGSKSIDGVWELNRFCSNYKYHIIGIGGKLLEHFKRNYIWLEIYSYADRRWSNGNLYKQIGFNFEHETRPNYWYIKGYKRIHRFSLKKNIDDPKDIPEWLLRESEGYNRVWDCGSLKFSIKNE